MSLSSSLWSILRAPGAHTLGERQSNVTRSLLDHVGHILQQHWFSWWGSRLCLTWPCQLAPEHSQTTAAIDSCSLTLQHLGVTFCLGGPVVIGRFQEPGRLVGGRGTICQIHLSRDYDVFSCLLNHTYYLCSEPSVHLEMKIKLTNVNSHIKHQSISSRSQADL